MLTLPRRVVDVPLCASLAQEVIKRDADRKQALAQLKAARRTRNPVKMAEAAMRASASGVVEKRLIREVSTDAVAIHKSRKRSRMLDARLEVQQLSSLEPDVHSSELMEAMELAKDAGVADDVLQDADRILQQKMLLEDIAGAMRSQDAGQVQALCAMAEHARLPSDLLESAKVFLKQEHALATAVHAIYSSHDLHAWRAALSAARACGVDDALTKLAEGVGLIARWQQ